MIRFKAVALGSLIGVALALAPLSSAFADDRSHNGHWVRGGHWGHGQTAYVVHGGYYGGHAYGGHGGYYGYGAWPIFGLGAAVVGAAAAIVTAPFALLAAAANAPYYGPAYSAPPVTYNTAPPAYYGAPAAPAYYDAPAAPTYAPPPVSYSPPAAPAYYAPPARYYAPPAVGYYGAPAAPAYYAPPAAQAYYGARAVPAYYAPPPGYYGQPSTAPGYSYDNRQ
jgi:hypothetical protein